MSGITTLLLGTSCYPVRVIVRKALLEDRLRILEAVYDMLEKVDSIDEAKKRVLLAITATQDALERLPELDYIITTLQK